jgi:hypothetical protein
MNFFIENALKHAGDIDNIKIEEFVINLNFKYLEG